MRDLTTSMIIWPRSLWALGVRQMANFAAPWSEGRAADAAASLDALTPAIEQRLDGYIKQTCEFGGTVQSAALFKPSWSI